MNRLKKILSFVLILIAGLFLVGIWYTRTYSMEEAKAFEVHSPNLDKKLLIATQGSDFKNSVTAGIVEQYEMDSIYIKVIDVSDLDNIDPDQFDALVIVHTWENWKPPKVVQSFIEEHNDAKNKMVVLTTSGEGSYKMDNVDAITGESEVGDAPSFVDRIVERLNPLLGVGT